MSFPLFRVAFSAQDCQRPPIEEGHQAVATDPEGHAHATGRVCGRFDQHSPLSIPFLLMDK